MVENQDMAVIDAVLEANRAYMAGFQYRKLPLPPRRQLVVVACMDARIDPARALGLEEGDAHLIRNAGGRMVEALRSLAISQQLLGTREVMVIHHTECGMLTFTDAELRAKLRDSLGADADHIAFLPFQDLESSVRADIAVYRAAAIVRQDVSVRGFIYDVRTGGLREVV